MTAEHNHPPRCCCAFSNQPGPDDICPACTEHGELAPATECPECHQEYGRPHTDYCSHADREFIDTGTMFAEVARPRCAYPSGDHGDGRGCDHDDCPRHGHP